MAIICPNCSQTSPEGSRHCVHCGHRLEYEQKTQFGMPALKPVASDAESLTSLGGRSGEEAAPRSPMAGLPRPRAASTPSPLALGLQGRAAAERPSSASATQMGMPLYRDLVAKADSAVREEPTTDDPEFATAPTEVINGASAIAALDVFDAQNRGAERAAVVSESAGPEVSVQVSELQPLEAESTQPLSEAIAEVKPAVEVTKVKLEKPAEVKPVAEVTKVKLEKPADGPYPFEPTPNPVEAPKEAAPSSGGALSRVFAAVVGIALLGLVLWNPKYSAWLWTLKMQTSFMIRTGLTSAAALGAFGVAASPFSPALRWALAFFLAAGGAASLFL